MTMKYNTTNISKLVGKKFIHFTDPKQMYKIKDMEDDQVLVSWDRSGILSDGKGGEVHYDKENVVRYLNKGVWLLKQSFYERILGYIKRVM